MTRLSEETKQAIVKKVLSNPDKTIAEIALANNIGLSTLNKLLKIYRDGGKNLVSKSAAGASPPLAERFKHLQATAGQESVMVSTYCRQHGLYPHQLTQWEADFMTPAITPKNPQTNPEVKRLQLEIKALNQIIRRKDKVLAETVALLVLKKKAAHIWGEKEDD